MAGTKRVDVQTATAGVTGIDREFERFAALPNVHKNTLHTLFMELVMVAKTHQILQQAFLVNRCAGVADLHAAPIGLARYQSIAF